MSLKCDEPSSSFQSKGRVWEYEFYKQNMKHWKSLDELLRCRICFEFFDVCMMTKCSHNYCSLCIRKYMTYKPQCPTCFQAASEPELRNNRIVDEILKVYRDISEILCETYEKPNSFEKKTVDFAAADSLEDHSASSNMALDICITPDEEDYFSNEPLDKVSCPVCSVPVLSRNINLHLDSCLALGEKKISVKSKERRSCLPKVVYHLLSDRDLKKKLKDYGLSTLGDRQALIRRHKNFLILYNAECDSLEPRPVPDLIKQLEQGEIAERASTVKKKVLCFDSKTDPEVIEQQQIMYLKQHSRQFKELVEDIHFRKKKNSYGENFQEYDQGSEGAVACFSKCFGGGVRLATKKTSASASSILPGNITGSLNNNEPDCIILEDFSSSKDEKKNLMQVVSEIPFSIKSCAEIIEGQSEEKCNETTSNSSSSEQHTILPKNNTQSVLSSQLGKRKVYKDSTREAGCSHKKK